LSSDPGVRAVVRAPVAVAVSCLLVALLVGGCASVPSISSAQSPSPSGAPPAVTPPTPQGAISVALTPPSSTIQSSQAQVFTATVSNDPKNGGVAWALSNCAPGACGTLSANTTPSGTPVTYTAPSQVPASATLTLTATAVSDTTKSASAAVTITALPAPINVSISPQSQTLTANQTQNFSATVQNDAQNKGVIWTLSGAGCNGSGCGTLSSTTSPSGMAVIYTAPSQVPSPASVTLTAASVTDGTKSASAVITLAAPAPTISVIVSPQAQTVTTSQTQNFSASVQNDSQNKGVTWNLSGAGCSGSACGTLNSTATASGVAVTYTAPSQVPSPASVTLTATSAADATKSASAAITITNPPPPISVKVSPQNQTVTTNQAQNFIATVQNDPQNKGVTWTISGAGCKNSACGALSSAATASGAPVTYTAPPSVPSPPTVTLTATSVADPKMSAAATITIVAPPPVIVVAVSPASKNVPVNQSQDFTASVRNDSQNKGVTWTLSGAGCSGALCGTLSKTSSASGSPVTYTAPPNAPNPPNVTLTATSVTDPKISMSAAITVIAIPANLGVTISPKRGGITVWQTLRFSATVQNDPTNQGVTWSASSGTFTNVTPTSAVYNPPSQPGVYTITAASNLDSTKRDSSTIGVTDLSGVTTYHNDSTRTGVNSKEFALTPSNVQSATFGKLFSCSVDAAIYPQTLWVANVSIGGGTHNVIFTATSHNTVYAFDADANPCVTYWSKQLVPSGETWPNATDMGSQDIQPDWGVVGTPVIDPVAKILYVVTKTKNVGTGARGPGQCHQRLHALNLSDGSETANGPLELTPAITVPGTGDGSNGSSVPFDPFHENQRPGLALVNDTVYLSWGSVNDQTPWHGWIMGFNKSNLGAAPMLFNASPNGKGAGIWMAGGAPSVDSSNNIYVITGNGDYDGAKDFGDSFVKVNSNLVLQDWFTPFDEATMNSSNGDLGAGGAAVLADLPSAPVKHLLIGGGKIGSGNEGEIYVLNRDAMGHLENTGTPIVQKFPLGRYIFATPVFWNNTLFIAGLNGPLVAFALNPTTGLFNPNPTSSSSALFPGKGATPSVSGDGNSHGIVWAVDTSQYGPPGQYGTGPAVLHAYDATNLGRELWNSAQAAANRDQAGNAVKFTVPTIANGKVYIGSSTEIDVFGLLPN
jgi:hypothetical protein